MTPRIERRASLEPANLKPCVTGTPDATRGLNQRRLTSGQLTGILGQDRQQGYWTKGHNFGAMPKLR